MDETVDSAAADDTVHCLKDSIDTEDSTDNIENGVSIQSAVAPAATASTPAAFIPHSNSIGSAQQDSRADGRLQAHLH